MGRTNRRTFACPRSTALLLLTFTLSLASLRPAYAADDAPEREQFAAIARQIELADRLTSHLADQAVTAQPERARYYFDYARLRADLQRIRAGLQDYLVPHRAQPRDPGPLIGEYLQSPRDDPSRDERPESTP